MDHEQSANELIELGVVSADTKGSLTGMDDEENGYWARLGLGDD